MLTTLALLYVAGAFGTWLLVYGASERRHFTPDDYAAELQEQAEALAAERTWP